MSTKDARGTILARRARFVAAAMASVGVAACGKSTATPPAPDAEASLAAPQSPPAPCLSISTSAPPPPAPMPCLSVAAPPARDAEPEFDCNPPYSVDAKGKKKTKPECR